MRMIYIMINPHSLGDSLITDKSNKIFVYIFSFKRNRVSRTRSLKSRHPTNNTKSQQQKRECLKASHTSISWCTTRVWVWVREGWTEDVWIQLYLYRWLINNSTHIFVQIYQLEETHIRGFFLWWQNLTVG